jgi:hypothetical protein
MLVAKLLYLWKRARPDIIAVVGFLCTRVKGPTEEDEKKLSRVLSYLNGSKDQVMKLKPSGIFKVEAFVDVSFTTHPDGKSHSEIVIQVGGVSMECRCILGQGSRNALAKARQRRNWWPCQTPWGL